MIFDRMAPHYGPRQDFGMRYQDLGERTMDLGGGMGRERFDIGGGVLGGQFRGAPPMSVPTKPMQGPVFGIPPMSTGAPPMQANPWMGGPQSSLGRWFNTYRMGAYS